MKNIKNILDEVLKEIQPDKEYEEEIFKGIKEIIKKISKNQKYIMANLGGSGAKGTWLKTFDADIFVLFDYKNFKDKTAVLSDILEKILKKRFKRFARLHGSRDYFQLRQGKFTFEIIPILKISKSEMALNITDVSPLHFKWVSRHKSLINEMKLTKQFCQAQNIYGAESYIRGFSGYICEILTVYYGSFYSLMKNAAKWPSKVTIDVEKYYRGKDIFKIINTSKLTSPLIVIDPVQKDRNAAAALSQEKFDAFRQAAMEFIIRPSKDLFYRKDLKRQFLDEKAKNKKLVIMKVKPLPGKIDVVGGKLLKIFEFIGETSKRHGFKMTAKGWEWDKRNCAYFYFLFDKKPLPDIIEIEGPPRKLKIHVDNFKRAHKKTFEKAGIICAIEKRQFIIPETLLNSLLKHQFVKERCKSISLKIL